MASAAEQPLEQLAGKRFSFYPAIRNIEHNEWTLEQATWSEALAKNTTTGQEIWIPRSHLGEISSSDSPVLIVGLKRELEYKNGAVTPFRKAVVQMRAAPGTHSRAGETAPQAPRRQATAAEKQTFSFIGKAVLAAVAVCLLVLMLAFSHGENPLVALFRSDSSTADQRYLSLRAIDTYRSVVEKMGPPETEKWISREDAELQFETLGYPSRHYVVLLMGGTRESARYIGTLHDPSHKILDAAKLSHGGDTSSMLKNLPDF